MKSLDVRLSVLGSFLTILYTTTWECVNSVPVTNEAICATTSATQEVAFPPILRSFALIANSSTLLQLAKVDDFFCKTKTILPGHYSFISWWPLVISATTGHPFI